jgi:hypothetical protein
MAESLDACMRRKPLPRIFAARISYHWVLLCSRCAIVVRGSPDRARIVVRGSPDPAPPRTAGLNLRLCVLRSPSWLALRGIFRHAKRTRGEVGRVVRGSPDPAPLGPQVSTSGSVFCARPALCEGLPTPRSPGTAGLPPRWPHPLALCFALAIVARSAGNIPPRKTHSWRSIPWRQPRTSRQLPASPSPAAPINSPFSSKPQGSGD